ncbi:Chemotaxis response regulator protein-glutamate methylesterase [Planctomycetes bacterium CA13]|uniref:Protein-glutamate methylesterase/protein-glutamine glutaminase n=1 Tax=Novipirellula herctigrandis TaxID=2527986 RepID=A0A5C5YWF9_9BACT|nr:Chemotaxis response regulator protein-glutamate methylesterase [Planctomycetes bacterium CA13]
MAIRTIVVDDSIVFRKAVRDSLAKIKDVEVISIAKDGLSAVQKIKRYKPDLVTLDVEMPGLDGLQVLLALRDAGIQTTVIMVSSHTERGASVTTQALNNGAFDFVLKPSHDDPRANAKELHSQLQQRIAVLHQRPSSSVAASPSLTARKISTLKPTTEVDTRPKSRCRRPSDRLEAIVIGISTGGPKALRTLIPELPANLSVPVMIVQHMPPIFTRTMAEDLDRISHVNVVEGVNGSPIEPGTVYIAPGGKQMRVSKTGPKCQIEVNDAPAVNNCKPSVDYLFESAAIHYGRSVLGIVMTGMGSDGTAGSELIAKQGGCVWAQNEATCTVYGMPRRVIESDLADDILSLDQIQNGIIRLGTNTASSAQCGALA